MSIFEVKSSKIKFYLMKKLLLFLKNSILLFILFAISYQVKAQDTTPPVFAMPENASFDCVLNGQTRVLNYQVAAGDKVDDGPIITATNVTGGAAIARRLDGTGVIFDITPTNSMVITSLDVSPYTEGVATNPYFVEVYYKRGTRSGFENNAAAWTLAANTTISFTGANLSYYNVEVGNLALLAGETYSIWVRGYSPTVPSILAFSLTANSNIEDANFTTSNHVVARGLFSGTVSIGQDAFFLGKINYVLATSTITQIAGLPSGSAFPIGVTTNTFRATDIAGNIATKSFTVTVNEDTQKPTLTAKPNYTRNADTGNCSFTNTDIPNGIATDNCSVASYSYVLTGATTGTVTTLVNQAFNVGVTTVTWTATDTNGNVSNSDAFTVTVNDTQLPTLTAKANFTRNTNNGTCTFTNTDIPNGTATDNCAVASYSYVLTGATTGTVTTLTNQVFNVGVTTVTWTATDVNGNVSANDDFTVTVNAREINILGNAISIADGDISPRLDDDTEFGNTDNRTVTYTIQNTGNCILNISSITSTGTHASDFVVSNIPSSVAAGGSATFDVTFTPSGTGLRTATITINNDDTDEGVYDFAIQGAEAIVITAVVTNASCPSASDGSIDLTITGGTGLYVYNWSDGATTQDITGLSIGTYRLVAFVDRGAGRWIYYDYAATAPYTYTVGFTDAQAPVAVCQDITIQLDASNNATITASQIDNGSSDNCGIASLSVSPSSFTCADIGANTVTLTVTDVGGNTSSCTATVTVEETTNPIAVCQNITVQLDVTGTVTVNASQVDGGSSDNCSISSMRINGQPSITYTCANAGTNTVTFEVADATGNTANCTATITVVDAELPTLIAQADFTRNADNGLCNFTNTDIPNGIAADNCSVASYQYILSGATTGTVTTLTSQVFNVGTTTVTWTATDVNGNTSATDDFTVTISDTQLPTLTAKPNYTRNVDVGNCNFTNTDIPNGIATDNCSVASYSYVLTGATTGTVTTLTNQVFNLGTTTVTWTATDVNGNTSATDDFTVTISDTQLPTLTAQTDFTRNADNGLCNFTNTDIPNGIAADNCAVNSYSYVMTGATTGTVTTLTNQAFNVGTTTVTWTATDANGNTSASDVFTITVNDTQNPVITCPTNIIVNNDPSVCGAVVNFALPTTTDNCGIASLNQTAGIASGNLYPVGTTTNTFVVTDNSGNTATCSFDVTVNQRYELLYSSTVFSEIYPTSSGVLGNIISIRSYACAIFTGINGEDYATTGKVTVSNIPNGLTASIIKISDTELAFKLNGSAINNAVIDEIENLTVIFNDAAFVGVTAANVINSTKTDLAIRFLDFIPLNLQATAVSTSQINLTWERNSQIHTAYRLYRNNRLVREFSANTTSYSDENLNADTYYSYKLVGIVNQNIETDPSSNNEWTFPEKPVLLSVSTICGNGKANLKIEGSGTIFRVYNQETNGNLLLESENGSFELPSVSQTTTFYISVIGRGGKESARTAINVEVQPTFEAKIIGENTQTSCENSIDLTAQEVENATYTWYLNGNNLGINGQNLTANYSGDYQVRIQKGICSFMSEKVTIQLNQNPVAKIQQQNGTRFCQNGMLSAVSAGENVTYEWILNNVVIGNNQNLEVTQSGIYMLQITNTTGCQASTSIEVVVADIPQNPILETSETMICPNSETIISIQNPQNNVIYEWIRNGRNIRQTGNSISTSIKGKYQVRVISNENTACSSVSNEIEINHFEMLPIYLRISEDKKALFVEDANNSQSEIASVEWYFEGELKADLGSNFEIIPTENGYYSAKITNQNGCIIQTRTVYFSVPKIPVITGEEDLKMDLFKIYPNPSNTGLFNIHFGTVLLEDTQITIFDGIGRNIYTTTFKKGSQDFKINLQEQPSGMYMIHFNQNNSVYSKQIIID